MAGHLKKSQDVRMRDTKKNYKIDAMLIRTQAMKVMRRKSDDGDAAETTELTGGAKSRNSFGLVSQEALWF